MNNTHLANLATLNELSDTYEGSLKIAESFCSKLIRNSQNANPWVCFEKSPEALAEKIFNNRGKSLSGLIIGVKDVIATEDFPTGMGTKQAWHNEKMGFDARIVSNFKLAGAVVGGKTKTSEFAVHRETDVINPNYPGFTAGTSSAGSAAAIANKSVKVSLGTQTAGSIARPASFCRVIGFKPSFGDFPRTGVLKTCDEFDTVGLFVDDLETLKAAYNLIKVQGPNYPIQEKQRKLAPTIRNIAVLCGPGFDNATDEIRSKLHEIAKILKNELNLNYVEGIAPEELQDIRKIHLELYSNNLKYYFDEDLTLNNLSNSFTQFVGNATKLHRQSYEDLTLSLQKTRTKVSKEFQGTLFISLASNQAAPKSDASYDFDVNSSITALGMSQIILPGLISDYNNRNIGLSLSTIKYSDLHLLALARTEILRK